MSSIEGPGEWGPAEEQQLRAIWVEAPPKLDGPVLLAAYSPQWPRLYEREADRIRSVLGNRVLLLEHIGSTSVPGLAAKPIIDILMVVADPADEPSYVPPLEGAGYRLVIREPGWYQHRVLNGPDTDLNLHVHPPGSPEIDKHLRFRDHLRANPADRELYERAKQDLAAKRWTYIQQYADAKTEVIDTIMGHLGENPALAQRTLDFVLEALVLPFCPRGQAGKGLGPVLLVHPGHRHDHDGDERRPLVQALAPQHVNQHAHGDHPDRRSVITAGRPRYRPTGPCRGPGLRRHAGILP